MVGRPHGHGGHGLRSAARPAHHGGRGDDTGVEAAGLTEPEAADPVEEPVTDAEGHVRRPTPSNSPSPTASGQVRSYDTDGGRAVFDLGEKSAALVSATPGTGWSMQVWKTESWIRVEFTSGTDRVSVFCTWHDGPPRVEIGTY